MLDEVSPGYAQRHMHLEDDMLYVCSEAFATACNVTADHCGLLPMLYLSVTNLSFNHQLLSFLFIFCF